MGNDSNLLPASIDEPANGAQHESHFVDTKVQFEAWLDELKPGAPQINHQPPDFIIECNTASNCKIQFAGVLYLEGFLGGDIRSPGGTLVTGPGIINGNIEVGTAIIGSYGNVNLTATERVLLRGNVIVEGKIRSSSLSIKEGTYFDGSCTLLETLTTDPEPAHLLASEAVTSMLTVGVAAD